MKKKDEQGKVYTVTDIIWDTDGQKVKLPKQLEVVVPEDITEPDETLDYISDAISDMTGFCHGGFATTPEIN